MHSAKQLSGCTSRAALQVLSRPIRVQVYANGDSSDPHAVMLDPRHVMNLPVSTPHPKLVIQILRGLIPQRAHRSAHVGVNVAPPFVASSPDWSGLCAALVLLSLLLVWLANVE